MTVTSVSEGLSYLNASFSLEREKDGDLKLSLKIERLEYRRYYEVRGYRPLNTVNLKKWHDDLIEWVKQILEDQKSYLEKRKKELMELMENLLDPVKVARRILEFALSLSGGDPSKVPILREAVEKAFEEVRELFGGTLPEVSEKTRDLVMRGFDEWERNGSVVEYFEQLEYVREEVEIELVA